MVQFFGREPSDESGERVRNTWAICPLVRDSLGKPGLIPDVVVHRMMYCLKIGILRDLSLEDEPAAHQLVGKVMAYQGYNG